MPFFKIIRPFNCLFAVLTTLFGIFYLQCFAFNLHVLSALISVFLISAAGYTINDFFDHKIDKINKPERVLPSGQITLNQAKIFSFVLFCVGVFIAVCTLNKYCILIAIINSISLYFYAKNLKKQLFIGNMVVAWNACSTFIYGALITNNIQKVLPIIIFSFLYTIIREWVKTIEDCEGDKQENVKSIVVLYGMEMAKKVIYLPILLTISSVLFFSYYNYFTADLFFLFILLITFPLLIFMVVIKKAQTQQTFHKIQSYMKLDMLCIVIVFIINDIIKFRLIT